MKENGVKVGENSVARDALLVFAGNASRGLAAAICQHLDVALGHAEVRQFSDPGLKSKALIATPKKFGLSVTVQKIDLPPIGLSESSRSRASLG